jgi:hypothetical protein
MALYEMNPSPESGELQLHKTEQKREDRTGQKKERQKDGEERADSLAVIPRPVHGKIAIKKFRATKIGATICCRSPKCRSPKRRSPKCQTTKCRMTKCQTTKCRSPKS